MIERRLLNALLIQIKTIEMSQTHLDNQATFEELKPNPNYFDLYPKRL